VDAFRLYETESGFRAKRGSFECSDFLYNVLRSSMARDYVPFRSRRKHIRHYTEPIFYTVGGACYVEKRRRYVSEHGLPIKPNSVCRMIGYTPNYVGYKPSYPYPINYKVQQFLSENNNFLRDFDKKGVDVQRQVWTGSYDTYKQVLEEFATPVEEKLTCEDYLKILEEEKFPWLRLPRLKFPTEEDLKSIYINPDAHPGFFTKLFFGDSRKETVNKSIEIARTIFRHLKTKRFAWQGLWTLGGRSKDVKTSLEYSEDIATRAIWIPEEPLVLLSLIIVQPITAALKYADTNCIFIGKNFSIRENRWIGRMKANFDWQFRCDWRHFDADVTKELVLAAFSLLRKVYPENDRSIDRYFSFLYDTIMNKNVVIPPGFVYKFKKGMPSGHPLVSLINTLVNYIVWVTILQKVLGKGRVAKFSNGIFGGDDTQIFCKWDDRLLDIDNIIKKTTHLRSDSVVASLSPTLNDETVPTTCRFFKRFIDDKGMTRWHFPSVLRKFIFNDSKDLDHIFRSAKWLSSAIITCPFDSRLEFFANKYIRWLIERNSSSSKDKNTYINKQTEIYGETIKEAKRIGVRNALLPVELLGEQGCLNTSNFFKTTNRKHISFFLSDSPAFSNNLDLLVGSYLMCVNKHHFEAFTGTIKTSLDEVLKDDKCTIRAVLNSSFMNRTRASEVFRLLSLRSNAPTIINKLMKGIITVPNAGLLELILQLGAQADKFKKVMPRIYEGFKEELKGLFPRKGIG